MHIAAGRPCPLIDPLVHDRVVADALEHGMASVLLAALADSGQQLVPTAQHMLAVEDMAARHRYATAELELSRAIRRAASGGFELGAFKGVTAAERWFISDPSARGSNDVDVFMDPKNFASMATLVSLLARPGDDVSRALARSDRQVTEMYGGAVPLDVHQDPMNLMLRSRQLDLIWSRTTIHTTRLGDSVRVLDPSLALIQMVINSLRDNYAYLLQVMEIGRALDDPRVDWAFVRQFIRTEGCEAMVLDGIAFVQRYLDIPALALTTRRPRSVFAAVLVPERKRVTGFAGWLKATDRLHFLPFWLHGRRREAIGWTVRHAMPRPTALVDAGFTNGSYPIRALRYRWGQIREHWNTNRT